MSQAGLISIIQRYDLHRSRLSQEIEDDHTTLNRLGAEDGPDENVMIAWHTANIVDLNKRLKDNDHHLAKALHLVLGNLIDIL